MDTQGIGTFDPAGWRAICRFVTFDAYGRVAYARGPMADFDIMDREERIGTMRETNARGETIDRGPRELNSLDRGGWSTVDILIETAEAKDGAR